MNTQENKIDHRSAYAVVNAVSIFDSVRIYLLKCGLDQDDATSLTETVVGAIKFDGLDADRCKRKAIKEAIAALRTKAVALGIPVAAPPATHVAMRKADPYRLSTALVFANWFGRWTSRPVLAPADAEPTAV